ncbi:MAG: hypothetical protein RL338_1534, partial [Chloroflexota bacterium]
MFARGRTPLPPTADRSAASPPRRRVPVAPRSARRARAAVAALVSVGLALGALGPVVPGVAPVARAAVACTTDCYVATTGNDSTGDGTAGSPFLTIAKGIAEVSAGGTVHVAAGTYVEDLAISKQLTLRGPNGGIPAGPDPTSATRVAEAVVLGATIAGADVSVDGVVIDGMKFMRPSGATVAVDVRLVSNSVAGIRTTVRNSILDLGVYVSGSYSARGCGSAFSSTRTRTDVSSGVTLEYNGIYHQTSGGCSSTYNSRSIYLDSASPDNVVRGNYFHLASDVFATDTAHRIQIVGNRFQSGGNAVVLGTVQDAVVQGNTFVARTGGYAVYLDQSVRPAVEDNLFLDTDTLYPYVAMVGTSGALVRGNTFRPTTLAPAAYWAILVGPSNFAAVATGTTITNNDFSTTTAGALYSCKGTGTRFSTNRIGSPGKTISGTTGNYSIRSGATACAGYALDARGNLFLPGSGGVRTEASASTTLDPSLTEATAGTRTPGFWPASAVVSTTNTSGAPVVRSATVENEELANPSISFTLPPGTSAAVSVAEVTTTPTGTPFTTDGVTFVDISVTATAGTLTGPYTICLDSTSGTTKLWHEEAGGWAEITWRALPTGTLDPGAYPGQVCGQVDSFSLFGVSVPDPSTLDLSPASATADFGDATTFTAHVTAASGGADVTSGSVDFSAGSTPLCTGVALDANGEATCAVTLPAGTYTITATFSGSADYDPTAGTASLTVEPAASTLDLSPASATVGFGDSTTFTAHVTVLAGGADVTSGSVDFSAGSTLLCAGVALDANGEATCPVALPVGTYTIAATFSGTSSYLTSAATTALTVVPAATVLDLSPASVTIPNGDSTTFTAHVTAASGGADVTSGSVDFSAGSTPLCTGVALDANGEA